VFHQRPSGGSLEREVAAVPGVKTPQKGEERIPDECGSADWFRIDRRTGGGEKQFSALSGLLFAAGKRGLEKGTAE